MYNNKILSCNKVYKPIWMWNKKILYCNKLYRPRVEFFYYKLYKQIVFMDLRGYLFDFNYFLYPYFCFLLNIAEDSYMYLTDNEFNFNVIDFDNYSTIVGTTIYGIIIGVKACIMIFTFIWARTSFPGIRYDQLMSYCWTVLLPIVIAFIILVPCILYSFEIILCNILLV